MIMNACKLSSSLGLQCLKSKQFFNIIPNSNCSHEFLDYCQSATVINSKVQNSNLGEKKMLGLFRGRALYYVWNSCRIDIGWWISKVQILPFFLCCRSDKFETQNGSKAEKDKTGTFRRNILLLLLCQIHSFKYKIVK